MKFTSTYLGLVSGIVSAGVFQAAIAKVTHILLLLNQLGTKSN